MDLVLERAMSVTEIAARVDRPRGSVAHHVGVLLDAGLIRVVRTRRVRAVDERFYGRVALRYRVPHEPGEVPFLRDVTTEIDLTRMRKDDEHGVGGVTYRHARIPAERAAEFDARLSGLALEFANEPRDGDTEYGMYLALFPTKRTIGPGNPPPTDESARGAIDDE